LAEAKKNSIYCAPALETKMQDVCLEASQFQPLKISRFPNQIICGNSLMMPVGSGKESAVSRGKIIFYILYPLTTQNCLM